MTVIQTVTIPIKHVLKGICSHAEPVTLKPNRTFYSRTLFSCVILHQICMEFKSKAYLYSIKCKTNNYKP